MIKKKEAPKTKEDKPDIIKSLQDLKALYSNSDAVVDAAIDLVKKQK